MPNETGESAYQRLLAMTEGGAYSGVIDPSIMHSLAIVHENTGDADTYSVPMLIRVSESKKAELTGKATIYSSIGSIMAIGATPEQLITLLQMQEISYFEGSKPASGWE